METGSRIKSVCVIVGGLGLGLFIASGGQAQVIHPDQMIGVPRRNWRSVPARVRYSPNRRPVTWRRGLIVK